MDIAAKLLSSRVWSLELVGVDSSFTLWFHRTGDRAAVNHAGRPIGSDTPPGVARSLLDAVERFLSSDPIGPTDSAYSDLSAAMASLREALARAR